MSWWCKVQSIYLMYLWNHWEERHRKIIDKKFVTSYYLRMLFLLDCVRGEREDMDVIRAQKLFFFLLKIKWWLIFCECIEQRSVSLNALKNLQNKTKTGIYKYSWPNFWPQIVLRNLYNIAKLTSFIKVLLKKLAVIQEKMPSSCPWMILMNFSWAGVPFKAYLIAVNIRLASRGLVKLNKI